MRVPHHSPSIDLYLLYSILLDHFGPQHWWPADTRYEVVVGALLTQNTNWTNVEKALERLKSADALSPHVVLEMEQERLAQLIRPAGFYRQKATRLKLLTKAFLEAPSTTNPLQLRKHYLAVCGVGYETADSIVLYAHDLPIFVIDAYTRRMLKRFYGVGMGHYDDYRRFFEQRLRPDVELYKEFHALIVAWGKQYSRVSEDADIILKKIRTIHE